ncbi:MAG: radical SAM protein, partial [Negativicutes bacterium]|nr:radical SAM protein [Negativicutes bacterium]
TITPADVAEIIDVALQKSRSTACEVAFYGGSFTALPEEEQEALLNPVHERLRSGQVRAIRISTRPDYIDAAIVSRLKQWGVQTIELGAQSLDNCVLEKAERGHRREDIAKAVGIIKAMSLSCGLQLMVGLPGEDWLSLICSAQAVVRLMPDFIRIYPTLVIADTPLARLYRSGVYQPLDLDAAVARCAFLKIFMEDRHGIPVIRTGLQASDFLDRPGSVLAGPYHPAFGEMVDAHIFYLMLAHLFTHRQDTEVFLRHNPKDHSKVRGILNSNTRKWQETFPTIRHIDFAETDIPVGSVEAIIRGQNFVVNRGMIIYI